MTESAHAFRFMPVARLGANKKCRKPTWGLLHLLRNYDMFIIG